MLKRFSLYTVTSVTSAAIGFFVTLYLTRHLTPENFGYIGLYGTLIYFLNPMMTFNSSGLISINIINYNNIEYQTFINSFITLYLIIASALLLISIIAGFLFPQYWLVIIMSFIISFFTILLNIHYIELVQEKKTRVYVLFQLLYTIIAALLTILLVGFVKLSWEGRLLGIILALFFTILIMYKSTFHSLKKFSWNFNLSRIKEILHYGYPLVIGLGAAWIITQADKYIVLRYFDMKSLGYYSLAYTIGMKVTILNSSLVNAIYPSIYTALKEKKAKRTIRNHSLFYILFLVIFTICAMFFIKYFGVQLLGEKFKNSIPIVMLILIAGGFDGAYRVHGLVIEYFKKTKLKTKIAYFIAFTNILVSILLIPKYGVLAPAIGTILSYMLNFILTYIFALRILNQNQVY